MLSDKIAEVINKVTYKHFDFIDPMMCRQSAQAIQDLIAKELPKEIKETSGSIVSKYGEGYNQCLADIKHKLGVE